MNATDDKKYPLNKLKRSPRFFGFPNRKRTPTPIPRKLIVSENRLNPPREKTTKCADIFKNIFKK